MDNKANIAVDDYDLTTCTLVICLGGLVTITVLSAAVLSSIHVTAEGEPSNTVNATASVTVPASCTMDGTGMNSHTATISPGTWSGASGSDYEQGIGQTTFTTFCNDSEGFSIYAVGYTGNTIGTNTLVGASSTHPTISTGTATSGNTSNWSMKVTKVNDSTSYMPNYMNIDNSFNAWHAVPSTYTQVAHYAATTSGQSSATDTTKGAKVTTTYAIFTALSQLADTYTGQVKYTLVHPNTNDPNSFMVNFIANGGTGTMAAQKISRGVATNLSTNTFTAPSGYAFKEWNTKADGTGTSYAAGASVTNLADAGSTVTLYAQWQ